jgi:hypothetical protein
MASPKPVELSDSDFEGLSDSDFQDVPSPPSKPLTRDEKISQLMAPPKGAPSVQELAKGYADAMPGMIAGQAPIKIAKSALGRLAQTSSLGAASEVGDQGLSKESVVSGGLKGLLGGLIGEGVSAGAGAFKTLKRAVSPGSYTENKSKLEAMLKGKVTPQGEDALLVDAARREAQDLSGADKAMGRFAGEQSDKLKALGPEIRDELGELHRALGIKSGVQQGLEQFGRGNTFGLLQAKFAPVMGALKGAGSMLTKEQELLQRLGPTLVEMLQSKETK